MIAMEIIAAFFLIGGVVFLFDARKRSAEFVSWETATPLKVAVDFSKPGKYETDFNQTCSSSHGEAVVLRIPPEVSQGNTSTQLLSGLVATLEIKAISTTNVIESATADIFWQTEPIDGAIPIFSISPFRKGVYRASIVVTEGASALTGHEQGLEARYLLCGLEALPAEIAKYFGLGLLVIGLVLAGIPGLVLLKRNSNLSGWISSVLRCGVPPGLEQVSNFDDLPHPCPLPTERESPLAASCLLDVALAIAATRHFKKPTNDSPSPRGRLESLEKRRKESAAAGGPQGRVSGSKRVHAGMRASVNTIQSRRSHLAGPEEGAG